MRKKPIKKTKAPRRCVQRVVRARKRSYWTVFWRVNGGEHNISCTAIGAAAHTVRLTEIADVIVLVKCSSETAL